MDRRFFLKNTLSVSVLSSLAVETSLRGLFFEPNGSKPEEAGRILVLVQLEGGNDGLNTVIPLDQYANLYKARKNLLIPDKKVLPLYNSSITGFHPAMSELQKLYNQRKMTVIQGVGCTNPDLSHFKAIDIWHTGCDVRDTISTGWLGRLLDNEAEQSKPDYPPAVQIGSTLSKILQGASTRNGMIITNTSFFYDLIPGPYETASKTLAGDQLSFFRSTIDASNQYLLKVKAAAAAQKNLSAMYPSPGSNSLADQLKITAQLIGGGLQTKVYIVNLKGFDTHDEQVDASDTTAGAHADLLSQISIAIAAFEDDLALMGKQDKVLGMVYSEFGRRIKSNASYGCDHGTAAPVLLFGSKLKGGLIGSNPQIADQTEINDNLATQIDFRSVYASILSGWFGLDKQVVNPVLLGSYPALNLFTD